MPLTNAARNTLIEEMAQAITLKHTASKFRQFGDTGGGRILANACLPAIDRMLAALDLDELMTNLGWFTLEGLQRDHGGWWASITVSANDQTKATRHFRGEGDTPTAAIMASLQAAHSRAW